MKKVMKIGVSVWMTLSCLLALGQNKVDEKRMEQDIEVAENILGTLFRQHFNRRNFFPMEIKGTYMAGYGVTFRLPHDGPFMFLYGEPGTVDIRGGDAPGAYSWSISKSSRSNDDCEDCKEKERTTTKAIARTKALPKVVADDSLKESTNKIFLEVAKSFLADYGDVLSQLRPDERITVTNQSGEFRGKYDMVWTGGNRRSLTSAEAKYDDILQAKQGKISRDQFLSRLKVINTETTDDLAPDLEVFSSLLGRLYREDLSKTYYSDNEIGYERLKDFGVVYYMRVYSSSEEREGLYIMPTLDLRDVSKEERDKKVKELYPKFESELKENLVEYGRTLKSLKDEEQVMVNVRLTKCAACGIPATLEMSIKSSALKDYNAGKATKEATIAKVSLKKSGTQ